MFCEIPPQFLARLFSLRFSASSRAFYIPLCLSLHLRDAHRRLFVIRAHSFYRPIVYTASTCHNPACFPSCPFPLSPCFFQTTSSRAIGKRHSQREREFLRGRSCDQNLGYPRLARRNVTRRVRLSEILLGSSCHVLSVSSGFPVNRSRKISIAHADAVVF